MSIDNPDVYIPEIVLRDDVERISSIRVYGSLKEAQEYIGNGMIIKEQGREIYYVIPKTNKVFKIINMEE